VFAQWQADLADLARCGNVSVKLGGAGRPQWGFGFDTAPGRPSSQQLAGSWRPYMMSCIELFGPDRCMFESNFPADRVSYDYGAYWNAVKTLTAGMSPAERGALFAGTARRVYRMELSPEAAS
jgi:predicted TIM-barrel fold metal-dependent hydrolase